MKAMAMIGMTAAAFGGGMYFMSNQKMRQKTGKAVLKAMDNAEDMIAKKMN